MKIKTFVLLKGKTDWRIPFLGELALENYKVERDGYPIFESPWLRACERFIHNNDLIHIRTSL